MLAAGAALLFIPAHGYSGRLRLWLPPLPLAWTCVVLVAAGIAIAWWARLYLGRLWSGTVTAKANHRVVDTGPYALVRHPIYSGLLLSIYATMIAKGTIGAAHRRRRHQGAPGGAVPALRTRRCLRPLCQPHSHASALRARESRLNLTSCAAQPRRSNSRRRRRTAARGRRA
jgi:hypothetical protein